MIERSQLNSSTRSCSSGGMTRASKYSKQDTYTWTYGGHDIIFVTHGLLHGDGVVRTCRLRTIFISMCM